MQGQAKRLGELDKLELLNRATAYNKSVAKGAEVLYKNDVNGGVFLTMTNEEFKELGIESFGVRKSLMMFREKILKLENKVKYQSLEPIPDNPIAEKEMKEPGMNYQPGETLRGEVSEDDSSTSEEIYQKPKHNQTFENKGENDVVDDCKNCFTEVPNVKGKKTPRVGYKYQQKNQNINDTDISRLGANNEYLSEERLVNEEKNHWVDQLSPKKMIHNNDNHSRLASLDEASSIGPGSIFHDSYISDNKSTGSIRSMVSSMSLLGRRKLKDWVLNEKATWKEDGKPRSADTFMELRTENLILLEGYLKKLTGVNSKWMVNHWTSRYGVLLKSRVFLLFQYDRKSLYLKSSADLRMIANIGQPQSDIAAGTLKFDISLKTDKRIVLGFKTKAKLMMWRNDIISLWENDLENIEEKENM